MKDIKSTYVGDIVGVKGKRLNNPTTVNEEAREGFMGKRTHTWDIENRTSAKNGNKKIVTKQK